MMENYVANKWRVVGTTGTYIVRLDIYFERIEILNEHFVRTVGENRPVFCSHIYVVK